MADVERLGDLENRRASDTEREGPLFPLLPDSLGYRYSMRFYVPRQGCSPVFA